MELQDNYIRQAKVLSVYDGDTITILVDCGYYTYHKATLRLYGIDTPEVRTKDKAEKKKGLMVRDWLRGMILKKDIIVKSIKQGKKGKFGRFLCQIYINDVCINDEIVKLGYGKKYFGGKR